MDQNNSKYGQSLRSAKVIVTKLGGQHHKETPILTKFKVLMILSLQSQPAFTYSKLTIETLEQGV